VGCVPIYIYPFALICLISLGVGIYESKNRKIAYIIFSLYLLINLFVTNCYPPDKRDFASSKTYYGFEKFYKDNPDAKIIATSGARFLKHYYKNKVIFEFDSEKMRGSFTRDYIALIYGREVADKINKNNAYQLITPLILNKYKNPDFEKYFVENVYNKLQKGEKVVFSFLSEDDFPFIEEYEKYSKILKTKSYLPKKPKTTIKNALDREYFDIDAAALALFIESYSYEYLIELLDKYFKRVKFEQYTRLDNDDFVKNFEDCSDKYSTLWLGQHAQKSWVFVTYQKQ
jgi:hypothetical protein